MWGQGRISAAIQMRLRWPWPRWGSVAYSSPVSGQFGVGSERALTLAKISVLRNSIVK